MTRVLNDRVGGASTRGQDGTGAGGRSGPASANGLGRLGAGIAAYWSELAAVAAEVDLAATTRAAAMLLACHDRGRVVFVAGNGGSAATASHVACDLAKGTRAGGGPTFRVVALTDNVALLTAWANDDGYERVFAEQLRSLAQPGDLLLAISASGTSPNVVAAVEAARALGLETIGLTGRGGGRIGHLADLTIRIPSDRIELVEDAHLAIGHSLCVALRDRLARREPPRVVLHPPVVAAEAIDLTA